MLLFLEADGSMCFDACGFFGESRIRVDFGFTERAYDVDIQDNNRILMVGGGDAIDPAESKFLLARIAFSSFPTPGYNLDTSFSSNGKKMTSFSGRSLARSAAFYSDQIIVAGYADNGNDDDFAVVRYLNDIVTAPPTEPPEPTNGQYVYLPFLIR